MSEKTHQNGKGSKRRVAAKPNAYEEGYDAIDWSKGRVEPKPKPMTFEEALMRDYDTKETWETPKL
jgi:hypothetical protein